MALARYQLMKWEFPAERMHHGIPVGSGNFGGMIWGDGKPLVISFGTAEYWETRGAHDFREGYGYDYFETCVKNKEYDRIADMVERKDAAPGSDIHPTRLPVGRLVLDFGSDDVAATLNMATGIAGLKAGKTMKAEIFCASSQELLVIHLKGNFSGVTIKAVPGPQDKASKEKLRAWGYPPYKQSTVKDVSSWTQEQPAGSALAVAYKILKKSRREMVMLLSASVAGGAEAALEKARAEIAAGEKAGYDKLRTAQCAWWKKFWTGGGEVNIPDDDLAQTYYFWLYKLASSSRPGKLPVSLQGPWIEDYNLPKWSGDYHMDINVQEAYWPVYASNHLELTEPLLSWMKKSMGRWEKYGKRLTGRDNAVFVPVTANNAGENLEFSPGWAATHLWPGVGPFLGHNLWQVYTYGGNRKLLEEFIYPFLKKVFNFYETFLREDEAGASVAMPGGAPASPSSGALCFSHSHSPEWFPLDGGYPMGKNASIDLGLMHFLVKALLQASETLGVDASLRPRWKDIAQRLPLAAMRKPPAHEGCWGDEIELWQGEPLGISHRHMSHLIAIYPLALLDVPGGGEHADLVIPSIKRLWGLGTGLWAGLSFPWASMIMARAGFGDAAHKYLKRWRDSFSNQAYASYHDEPVPTGASSYMERKELMQLEGGFGFCAAVPEMLIQSWWGEIRLFPAIPDRWKTASFSNMRAEGAFIVSARYENGRTACATVKSVVGGTCRIRNSFGGKSVILKNRATKETKMLHGEILEFTTKAGEIFCLS